LKNPVPEGAGGPGAGPHWAQFYIVHFFVKIHTSMALCLGWRQALATKKAPEARLRGRPARLEGAGRGRPPLRRESVKNIEQTFKA
jgi:hypothetical protein